MRYQVTKPKTEVVAKSGSKLVAEVSILLDEMPGVVFNGFSIWQRAEGSIFVGLPSKPVRTGTYTKYEPYLQPDSPMNVAAVDAIKNAVVAAYVESGLAE